MNLYIFYSDKLSKNAGVALNNISLTRSSPTNLVYNILYFQEECNGTTPLSSQSQIRRRKKVTRMVAVVVALFAIFWFPIHFINVYLRFFKDFDTSSQMLYNSKIFAHTLSYANSCVNPFVYAFLNDGFKKAFNKTFPSCWWCPCARPKNYERCTQVTGMVDQAVQAIPDEEHENENDCELIQLNQVRKHSSKPSFV